MTVRVLSIVLLVLLAMPAVAQTQPAKPSVPAAPAPSKESRPLPTLNMVVSQRDRDAAYGYYRDEIAAGRCPAPLVRKGKECSAPPAPAARSWKLDQPLPDGVKAEAPAAGLIAKLSPSPAGHQYLRVDTDILVVGLGTRNVAALVVDLSRLQ
jgi:hypothetical protein